MSNHHPTLSPSKFPALAQCLCFQSGPAGEAAQRGTHQHLALEALSKGREDWSKDLQGDEAAWVQWAYDYIKLHASGTVHHEHRLSLLDDNFQPITFGTADAWCRSEMTGAIDLFDYKSGRQRDYSLQMMVYALMLMRATGEEACRVHLLYGETQYPKVLVFTRDEAERTVFHLIELASGGNKQPTPCDYCAWCLNAASCAALNERAVGIAKGREDWKLTNYHSTEITNPEEMAKALALARLVSEWAKAVEHAAKEMVIKQGLKIPGYTLQERSGNREITNVETAFQRVSLPQEKFLACCDVQIGALEKAYAEFHGVPKTQATKQINEKLGEVIQRRPSTKFLVKEKE